MNEPLLVFREIEKSYTGSQILCGVDLSLNPGKCILLSGKNGVGKTTLLKIIAGLEIPDLGNIEISGKTNCWKNAVRSFRKEIRYCNSHRNASTNLYCKPNTNSTRHTLSDSCSRSFLITYPNSS